LRLQGTCPPSFRESISWIISPSKFWTAIIFLHAHLHVVYYNCVKFHKNPISRLGGVALTRYMDGRTGRFLYTPPPPNFVCGGYEECTTIYLLTIWSSDLFLTGVIYREVTHFVLQSTPPICIQEMSEHNIHLYRLYNNTINEIPAKVDHTTWFSRHPILKQD
jgi:hypothetical protein